MGGDFFDWSIQTERRGSRSKPYVWTIFRKDAAIRRSPGGYKTRKEAFEAATPELARLRGDTLYDAQKSLLDRGE
jgi:hypothetical protein